jgi:hypothetical protein
MSPPEFALRVLRETTARALAAERKRRPLSSNVRRLEAELLRIDRDLEPWERKRVAS